MADDVDDASLHIERYEESRIAQVRRDAANIKKGYPGECESCEEPSPRLVHGYCARCRDKYDL